MLEMLEDVTDFRSKHKSPVATAGGSKPSPEGVRDLTTKGGLGQGRITSPHRTGPLATHPEFAFGDTY